MFPPPFFSVHLFANRLFQHKYKLAPISVLSVGSLSAKWVKYPGRCLKRVFKEVRVKAEKRSQGALGFCPCIHLAERGGVDALVLSRSSG